MCYDSLKMVTFCLLLYYYRASNSPSITQDTTERVKWFQDKQKERVTSQTELEGKTDD